MSIKRGVTERASSDATSTEALLNDLKERGFELQILNNNLMVSPASKVTPVIREAGDANAIEELWAESVRRHHASRREENRQSWIAFHRGLARAHAAISNEHLDKADALAVAGPGPDS